MVFGEIYSLSKDKKGFIRLIICIPELFKKNFVTFCLWDDKDLHYEGGIMTVGDKVNVFHRYNGKFPVLISMQPAPSILSCTHCFMHYIPKTVQTRSALKCPHCPGQMRPREIIQERFLLLEKVKKQFQFSKGICLKFKFGSEIFYTVLFEGSPFYKTCLKKNEFYNILCREQKVDGHFHFVEVLEFIS